MLTLLFFGICCSAISPIPSRSNSKLSMGVQRSCVLWANHPGIQCWGWGLCGGLGTGNNVNIGQNASGLAHLSDIDLGDVSDPIDLSNGYQFGCSLSINGEVKCWGYNLRGQLGQERAELSPMYNVANISQVNLGEEFKGMQIASGHHHSCVLSTERRLKCFGHGKVGALGLETNDNKGDDGPNGKMGEELQFVDVGSISQPKKVVIGQAAFRTCLIFMNNKMKCWGSNRNGELGQGHTRIIGMNKGTMGDSLPFINLGENFEVQDVALGWRHTCVLSMDNKVKCFGANMKGQLGLEYGWKNGADNKVDAGDEPHEMGDNLSFVDLGTDFIPVQLTAGSDFSCALSASHTVKCWGSEGYVLGQPGLVMAGKDPQTMGDYLPVIDLGDDFKVVQIDAGNQHVCALSDDDRIKCWGLNARGQLGIYNVTRYPTKDGQMGNNLEVVLDNPTYSPTATPSEIPSIFPSLSPTLLPTTPFPTLPITSNSQQSNVQYVISNDVTLSETQMAAIYVTVGVIGLCLIIGCSVFVWYYYLMRKERGFDQLSEIMSDIESDAVDHHTGHTDICYKEEGGFETGHKQQDNAKQELLKDGPDANSKNTTLLEVQHRETDDIEDEHDEQVTHKLVAFGVDI